MGLKILLMVGLPAFVIGTPLLVAVVVFGTWLRRSQRSVATQPFLGAVICGAVSFVSMVGAVAALALGTVREGYAEHTPLWPILMIGLLLLALATAFVGALFTLWMFWSLIAARAARAPARSAG